MLPIYSSRVNTLMERCLRLLMTGLLLSLSLKFFAGESFFLFVVQAFFTIYISFFNSSWGWLRLYFEMIYFYFHVSMQKKILVWGSYNNKNTFRDHDHVLRYSVDRQLLLTYIVYKVLLFLNFISIVIWSFFCRLLFCVLYRTFVYYQIIYIVCPQKIKYYVPISWIWPISCAINH